MSRGVLDAPLGSPVALEHHRPGSAGRVGENDFRAWSEARRHVTSHLPPAPMQRPRRVRLPPQRSRRHKHDLSVATRNRVTDRPRRRFPLPEHAPQETLFPRQKLQQLAVMVAPGERRDRSMYSRSASPPWNRSPGAGAYLWRVTSHHRCLGPAVGIQIGSRPPRHAVAPPCPRQRIRSRFPVSVRPAARACQHAHDAHACRAG